MKTGRIFWGVSLLTVGLLFLAHGVIPVFLDWNTLWRWWPLALVLAGFSLLLREHRARIIIPIVGGILLALFVYGLFSFLSPFERDDHGDGKEFTGRIEAPMPPSVSTASLTLEVGAGRVHLAGGAAALLEASSSGTLGKYVLEQHTEGKEEQLQLRLVSPNRPWRLWRTSHLVEVRLSNLPEWSIAVECGAARADIDLSSCTVRNLRLETGASSLHIRLGSAAPETSVHIEAGVSSISLEVPETAGCEIRIDAPLTRKRIGGFNRERSGLYRTTNFEDAERKIFVDAEAGVSSFTVTRYVP
jgi:hypothetical protein